jgi:GLPGLI family protein
MKKISYMIYFGILSVVAQNNLNVTYNVEFVFEENELNNNQISPFIGMAKAAEKNLKYSLLYRAGKSIFFKIDSGITNDNLQIASVFADADDIYYSDLQNKINYIEILQSDIFKKNEFIVKNENVVNWTILDSLKVIGDLKCTYAFAILDKDVKGTARDVFVEAWFAPEIPISSGPKEFGGLPGLIIQLRVNKTVFIAEKLDRSTEVKAILFPEKGQIISYEEYMTILRKRTVEIQSGRRE